MKITKILLLLIFLLITTNNFAERKEEILEISDFPCWIYIHSQESKEVIFNLENNGNEDLNDISFEIDSLPDIKIEIFPEELEILKTGESTIIKLLISSERSVYFSNIREKIVLRIQSPEINKSRSVEINILPPRNFWLLLISIFLIILISIFVVIYKKNSKI